MYKYKLDEKPRLTIKFSEFEKMLKGDISPAFEDHVLTSGLDSSDKKPFGIYNLNVINDACPNIMDNLYGVDLVNITFKNCWFCGVLGRLYISNVIFDHCMFDSFVFYRCSFDQVGFSDSRLYHSVFIENKFCATTFPHNYHIPMTCPETGSFTGWKQGYGGRIIQLEIPADAKRSSANGRKCRCSKAKVISIVNEDGNQVEVAVSYRNPNFVYKVGETVYPDGWNPDRWNECSRGIHFFMTRKEAVEYEFWGIYPVKSWDSNETHLIT